jgi:hypothetical protein
MVAVLISNFGNWASIHHLLQSRPYFIGELATHVLSSHIVRKRLICCSVETKQTVIRKSRVDHVPWC